MLSTGPGHYITVNKILAISGRSPNRHLPNPLSRQIQDAWSNNKVIDHTGGRATNSVIHLVDGYLVLSHIRSETLVERMKKALREHVMSSFIEEPTKEVLGGDKVRVGRQSTGAKDY